MKDDNTENTSEPNNLSFNSDQEQGFNPDVSKEVPKITPLFWRGSEFIEHSKGGQWIVLLSLVILAIAVGVYFVTGIFSAIVILIMGIVFGIVAMRKPRTQEYSINSDGVQIGSRFFPYAEFKSFSLYEEGKLNSIRLNPFKRFSPSANIYYDPSAERKIFDFISEYLPHEEASKDPIDQFMHKIRY